MPDRPALEVRAPLAPALRADLHARTRPPAAVRHLVAVGPGLDGVALATSPPAERVTDPAIVRAKITPPPVREATLARDRLLDWLDANISRRVVTITADTGYGKTTLLADFARRTEVRCL